MTGYDLKRIIDQSISNFWHAHHSQIYTTLRKMEADGLVESEIDGQDDKLNKRLYHITDAGRAEFHAWLSQPMTELPAGKNDHMVRLFFSAARDRETILNELHIQRQLHQQQLEKYQHMDIEQLAANGNWNIDDFMARMQHDIGFWQLTLQYGIAYEQLYVKTIDQMIDWVENRADPQPTPNKHK